MRSRRGPYRAEPGSMVRLTPVSEPARTHKTQVPSALCLFFVLGNSKIVPHGYSLPSGINDEDRPAKIYQLFKEALNYKGGEEKCPP